MNQKMLATKTSYDFYGNAMSVTAYDWFSPGDASCEARGLPTEIPPAAVVLRTRRYRIKKTAGVAATRMVYDVEDELIAEYTGAGSLTEEYIYRGSELIAAVDSTSGTEYAIADHLGTPRVWTNNTGHVVTGDRHNGRSSGAQPGSRFFNQPMIQWFNEPITSYTASDARTRNGRMLKSRSAMRVTA